MVQWHQTSCYHLIFLLSLKKTLSRLVNNVPQQLSLEHILRKTNINLPKVIKLRSDWQGCDLIIDNNNQKKNKTKQNRKQSYSAFTVKHIN